MRAEKKSLMELEKCYAVAPLFYQGKHCFLAAAERSNPCYLFDCDGNVLDKVWDGPGGVMTMAQVPGTNGQFLSTCKFYSPDDSKEAKIVVVTPRGKGDWEMHTLVDLPHIHRFDMLERDGNVYLIACTLKSGHEYDEDWRTPGKVYAAKLPSDLSVFDDDHQLELTVVKDNMLKNHGYYRSEENGVPVSIISCEQGVFRFTPPAGDSEKWDIELLLEAPVSDAVLVDLDGDGERELGVLSPFHGNQISVYKKIDGTYQKVYDYPEKTEFVHAVYGGDLCGVPAFVTGYRRGKMELLLIYYSQEKQEYVSEIIDAGRGPANVLHYVHEGKDVIIATNRETDEVAMYTMTRNDT